MLALLLGFLFKTKWANAPWNGIIVKKKQEFCLDPTQEWSVDTQNCFGHPRKLSNFPELVMLKSAQKPVCQN
ncbi:hypothetical protein PRUPE_5G077300 [Prunus persica]|uniref:Uncharacterized protein n=1 Tax=Prunus persica TaxID=3760 RepID=M5WCJ6_PRUPE|nr:hypothetical protein PRUPE_5G077300 [Prunus persica]